jgi:Cu-Zn family superoxide dismutase
MGKFCAMCVSVGVLLIFAGAASAQEEVKIEMYKVTKDGLGPSIGTITAFDTANGFLGLKFNMKGTLPTGGHGLHVHENGSCDPAEKDGVMVPGLAAGGHYDPQGTGKHEGPSGNGHLGDLPVLYVDVDDDGTQSATHTLVAPRLKLADIKGLAIIIHEGSDNFRDEPKPLGGGGARIACGLVPS